MPRPGGRLQILPSPLRLSRYRLLCSVQAFTTYLSIIAVHSMNVYFCKGKRPSCLKPLQITVSFLLQPASSKRLTMILFCVHTTQVALDGWMASIVNGEAQWIDNIKSYYYLDTVS